MSFETPVRDYQQQEAAPILAPKETKRGNQTNDQDISSQFDRFLVASDTYMLKRGKNEAQNEA